MVTPSSDLRAPPSRTAAGRADLITLGSRPDASWAFLAAALSGLDEGERDPEILALVAAHAIRLGLKSLAFDTLGVLPGEYASDPQVKSLRDATERLRPDALSVHRRIAIAKENLDALGDNARQVRDSFAMWTQLAAKSVACVARDGNITLRTDLKRPFRYEIVGDERARARASWNPRVRPSEDPTGEPPVFIAGFATPWLLERVIEGTPEGITGYSPTIWLYEPAAMRALNALSLRPMPELLRSTRLRAFLGAGAADRLRESLRAHASVHLPRGIVAVEPESAVVAEATSILEEGVANQRATHDALAGRIAARTSERDDARWGRRLDPMGSVPATRILIATTRYSTVMCAMAQDLADAFRTRGCETEVLVEPDTHSRLSSIAYLERIDRFDPDLIVLINYPRASLASAIPEGIPVITWVQDAMPHLLDPSLANKTTARDFAIGVLSVRIAESMGLDRATSRRFPVVANDRKFHHGPVSCGDELACEIAYVGHQSEPAEVLRDRFKAGLAKSGQSNAYVDPLFDAIRGVLQDPRGRWGWELRGVVRDVLSRHAGREPTHLDVERVIASFAAPVADRMVRHQSLGWAASICERRGWRLRIFGDGWDRHPTLGRYSRRRVEHGEPLREIYQSAAVNLHASVTTVCHQRVFECALSGGLPLCRYLGDAIEASFLGALGAAVDAMRPNGLPDAPLPALRVAEHPPLDAFNRAASKLGCEIAPEYSVSSLYEQLLRNGQAPAFEHTALHVFPEPGEVFFDSESALETRVLRAIDCPAWRATTSAGIAERVKANCSHDALARSMLALTHGALSRSASA